MAAPMIHHRGPEFGRIFDRVARASQELFATREAVMILAAGGTGVMEAAVSNTLSPGDCVIVVEAGKFGERWAEIGRAWGLQVHGIEVEWGRAVDAAAVEAQLELHPEARAVLVQHSETSTTVLHPLEDIAALTRERDCLLIVDGITSVGVVDAPMDAIGIDVLVTASQKALMLPPGLGLVALSEKAWQFNACAKLPRYYLDLAKERDSLGGHGSAYTPAISLIKGLDAVYDLIENSGGWSEAYRRQDLLARAARAGFSALGLRLLAPESPSPAATGVWLPETVDGGGFVRALRDVMGVTVAGGQGRLRGKVLRLGHLGYQDTFDVIVGLAAVEMALARAGAQVELGRGVAAAEAVLAEMYRMAE